MVSLKLLHGGHGQPHRGLARGGRWLCPDGGNVLCPPGWLGKSSRFPPRSLAAVLPCPALGEGPRRNI